jgi:predicted transcriptional regulator
VKTFNAYGIEKAATEVAGILRALANERRLMILCKLVERGEDNVNSLAETVSHRRPAHRGPLRHPAQALLQAAQATLNNGVSHVYCQN